MIVVEGAFNCATVFTDKLEEKAEAQLKRLCDQPMVKNARIRVMPDVHAGAGCTIGLTMTVAGQVVPNLVGVDIGCGMLTVALAEEDVDYRQLDETIRKLVPSGFAVRKAPHVRAGELALNHLEAHRAGAVDLERAKHSLGTLGGGNHFIELARNDADGRLYLVVHSGSRHIGLQVATHHQNVAAVQCKDTALKDLAALQGRAMADYLKDMELMQRYAQLNREIMVEEIMQAMGWAELERFTTVHNYLDLEQMVLRKGAVSARAGERLLIPLNMRDGSLVCRGKGNDNWNQSAPHGAGRVLSRVAAKRTFRMDVFRREMSQVFSTSVKQDTLDECPMAYKPQEEILSKIDDTVSLEHRLVPVYNFKAGKG